MTNKHKVHLMVIHQVPYGPPDHNNKLWMPVAPEALQAHAVSTPMGFGSVGEVTEGNPPPSPPKIP